MRLPLRFFFFLLSIIFFSGGARATEISTLNSTPRALGMGDAFTSLADDSSSLFYNPAGLARVHGLNWKIFGVSAGANGLDAYNTVKDFKGASSSSDFANVINKHYGDKVWVGAHADSAFTAPMFGIAAFDHADASLRFDNPVYPTITTNAVNDFGYVAGVGVPLSPFVHVGVDLKYVKRTGARTTFAAGSLADLNTDDIMSRLTQWGRGYGADAGVNFILPAPFFSATLSAVWKNIGQMHFASGNPSEEIPYEDNDVTLGLSLLFDTPVFSIAPAVDFRYVNSSEYQLTRKINFGLEIGLPLVDIRGGFHEGYYTYGAGVNLGLFRVDAASYGVELGAYPGQIEDRRYVLEFSMELGVGGFGVDGSSGGRHGSSGSSSSGTSSSSRSIWGSGRLKQRR